MRRLVERLTEMLLRYVVLFSCVMACTSAALSQPDYDRGVAALRDGRFDEALVALEAAVSADPTSVNGWWELGWVLWRLDRYEEGLKAWNEVARLDPAHPELSEWLPQMQARRDLAQETLAMQSAQAKGPASAADATAEVRGDIRIMAVGDLMMGSDIRHGKEGLPPRDGADLFVGLPEVMTQADVTFVNLEGPLSDTLPDQKCRGRKGNCFSFRTPTRYADRLVELGVDVVSLANNHASDIGPKGFDHTMKALDQRGIFHAARVGEVARFERAGRNIHVVAAHSGGCCLNVNRIKDVQSAIRRERAAGADIIIFSFHGGAEGSKARHVPGELEIAWGEKRGDVKALARAAIDAGADVVFGHGPHVLRAMELYKNKLIAYSLGNFCGYRAFSVRSIYSRTSVVLDVRLDERGDFAGGRIVPLRLDQQARPRLDPEKHAVGQLSELGKADFPDTYLKVSPDGTLTR